MKIAFFSQRYITGGMENEVYYLIRLLSKNNNNYKFTILYYEEDYRSNVMLDKYREFAEVKKILQLPNRRNNVIDEYDVLVNLSSVYHSIPIKAKKIIHWFHSCSVKDVRTINANDIIISQTQWHKEELLKLGIKSEIIKNVIDVEYVRQKAYAYNVNPTSMKNFVIVSRISKEKGFYRIIDFMKNIYGVVYIIGNGEEKIKQDIKLALGNKVEFIGELENPYPFIDGCDYLLSLSDHEIFGLTVAEAHILGTPVLFNHYETVGEQFVSGLDQFYDAYNGLLYQCDFNEYNNDVSINRWIELLS